jgi:hypothetical protein
VFFWLDPRRLEQLLTARGSRGRPHDVLTVDTASLVRRHRERVRLPPINSGAALYPGALPRGLFTFSTIEDYPYAERRRHHPRHAAIAELAVVGGVPDTADHVVSVQRISGADSSPAGPSDGTRLRLPPPAEGSGPPAGPPGGPQGRDSAARSAASRG